MLYKRSGLWDFECSDHTEPVANMLGRFFELNGLGKSFEGTLKIDNSEYADLLCVAYLQLRFRGSAFTDVSLVPSHGKHVILLGHHDELIVDCDNQDTLTSFVNQMADKGYVLDD